MPENIIPTIKRIQDNIKDVSLDIIRNMEYELYDDNFTLIEELSRVLDKLMDSMISCESCKYQAKLNYKRFKSSVKSVQKFKNRFRATIHKDLDAIPSWLLLGRIGESV